MRTTGFVLKMTALAFLAGACLSGCGFRGVWSGYALPDGEAPGEQPDAPAAQFTVTYRLDGAVLSVETVAQGERPASVPALAGDRGIVAWKNTNGTETDVWNAHIAADTVFEAVTGPELRFDGGYLAAGKDGLFHPLDALTRSEAARAAYALMKEKPSGETALKDVTTHAECWAAATSLVAAGFMSLDDTGRFRPDAEISRSDLAALLKKLFSPGAVDAAMPAVSEPVTRAGAAALINGLLGLEEREKPPYFPDVPPDMDVYAAVELAGIQGKLSWVGGERAAPGFVNLGGDLYCVGSDGYLLRDVMVGTLYFDVTGQYTSGDDTLDAYVSDIIETQTDAGAPREELLRTVYVYVRDHYLYLRRNSYAVGETGWEIGEALTMFRTGKGNCYNFAGAFWALARGVGYDAVCCSGLVGVDRNPHCWVEIVIGGTPYIFDPETEMLNRLVFDYTSTYKLTYAQGAFWSYTREADVR